MPRQSPGRRRKHVRLPEEVIREFPDRGFQWLLEEPRNAGVLLEFVAPDLAERLDFDQAKLMPRNYVQPNLNKHERDVLLQVPFIDAPTGERMPVLIYLMLEHQSQPDSTMALRLLIQMVGVWQKIYRGWEREKIPQSERVLSPIIPMVFYTGSSNWNHPLTLDALLPTYPGLEPFTPQWRTLLLSLKDLDAERLRRQASAMAQALSVWQAENLPTAELEARIRSAFAAMEDLDDVHASDWERAALFIHLLVLHRRSALDNERLGPLIEQEAAESKFRLQEVGTLMKTMAETLVERGEARGIEIGEKRGVELGALSELRKNVERVLRIRFGELPAEVQARIAKADQKTLELWHERGITAPALDDVLLNN